MSDKQTKQAPAVEAAAGEPLGALNMLRLAHKTLACAALTQIRGGERIWNEIGAFIATAPQPASEQQRKCACGDGPGHARSCPMFDESMMRYEPFGSASEQQAARELSDDAHEELQFAWDSYSEVQPSDYPYEVVRLIEWATRTRAAIGRILAAKGDGHAD